MINYEPVQEEFFSFLGELTKFNPPERVVSKFFDKGVEHCVSLLKEHFVNVSPKIMNLKNLTQDNYDSIRDLLAFVGTRYLHFTQKQTIPRLLW